jgi:hypothetical protein
VRVNTSAATFTFTYNSDPIPHLTGITNSISTAETYTFTYNSATPSSTASTEPESWAK